MCVVLFSRYEIIQVVTFMYAQVIMETKETSKTCKRIDMLPIQ